MPKGWLYALLILVKLFMLDVGVRRNDFKSKLSVKDISGPFGHLISTADGGWKKLMLQAVTVVTLAIDTKPDMSNLCTVGIVLWLGCNRGLKVQRQW